MHRFVRGQPLLCAAILISVCVGIAAAFALGGLRVAAAEATAELNDLRLSARNIPASRLVPVSSVRMSLQPFSSAQVVQALNDVAARVILPLEEISFTLDDTVGVPYLRYRASFSVVAKYTTVRRFIDGIHSDVPDISLDSVACKREAINAQSLKCDLVFSAFYLKDVGG